MNIEMSVGARFNIIKTCTLTGNTIESGWFENLVLDAGLNRIGTGDWFSSCHVGTSSVAPVVTNVALGNQIAVTSNTFGSDTGGTAASSPFYTFRRRTFRFNAGTFSGQNLAEVAIGWGGTNIFNRALIRDNLGDPTTITVLSTEVLDILTEVRIYQPDTDVTGTIALRQPNNTLISNHTYIARRSGQISNPSSNIGLSISQESYWYLYSGTAGTIQQLPSGSIITQVLADGNTITPLAYSNNSYEQTFNCNISLNSANSGTNRTLLLTTTLGRWQIEYTPVLPKNDTQVLTIPLKVSWGRYVP